MYSLAVHVIFVFHLFVYFRKEMEEEERRIGEERRKLEEEEEARRELERGRLREVSQLFDSR